MKANSLRETQPPHVERGGFKLKDAAAYLGGLSTVTVRRLIHKGLIRPNRQTRHLLISRQELDRFLAG